MSGWEGRERLELKRKDGGLGEGGKTSKVSSNPSCLRRCRWSWRLAVLAWEQ